MQKRQKEIGDIYEMPTYASVAITVFAACMLFAVGYNINLHGDLSAMDKKLAEVEAKLSSLESDNRDLRSRLISGAASTVPAPECLPAESGKVAGAAAEEKKPAAAAVAETPKQELAAQPTPEKKAAAPLTAKTAVDTDLSACATSGVVKKEAPKPEAAKVEAIPTPAPVMPDIVVKPVPPAAPEPKAGRISAYNSASGRVMINLGSWDGIAEGTRLGVYRDGKWIGDVRAAVVNQDSSMCKVEASGETPKAGDEVKPVKAAS